MPRCRRWIPVLVLLAALARAPLGAQPPDDAPRGGFGERVEVAEALLDVLVTDRQGNVVLGLGPDDFRVEVDGRPAEITGATFYSNRRFLDDARARALGVDPRAVPDHRLFVLFVDDQRFESFHVRGLLQRQADAGRELSEWLGRELQPNDLVAVVSFDVALRLHADLTSDLEALRAAVGRAVRGEAAPGNWPSRQGAPDVSPSLARALPEGEALERETAEIHKAITVLAGALSRLPGRKSLILLGTGFGEVEGGGYRPDARYHRGMIEALNSANVAVYPIDLTPTGSRHALEGSLSELALATGGEPFFDVIGFGAPLERIAQETNGYYLVSVRVGSDAAPGYRSISVASVNPEFRVRARGGLSFGAAGGGSDG